MSIFRSIATGYLGAKIANTEANDRLKASILESAGTNFYTNILPNAIEDEKLRKNNYNTLASKYTTNFAEIADASGYTADDASMQRLYADLEANNLDEEKLKAANFETDYNMRYNTRVKSFEEKYNPILNQIGLKEIGGLGTSYTATGFGESFDKQYPTDNDKKEALKNHVASLGTISEQKYFAISFPTGVTFSNGQDVRTYLLQLTRQ
jgi:hypothetical protein